MNRMARRFVTTSARVAIVIASGAGFAAPNLIVLMTDDLDELTLQRARELGVVPHFDAVFAAGGTRFADSFVTNSLCCPSRATFLTGQYTHNHGVLNITHDVQTPQGSFSAFDDSEHLGVWLQRAGYRTGMIGKFLNGYGYVPPRNCPSCDMMRYVPPGWDDWQAMPDYGERHGDPGILYAGAYCMYNYTINVNGSLVTYGAADADYQTDVIAQRAADFIDAAIADPRPFFLWLTPIAPHFELCLPAATPFEFDVRGAPRHADTLPPSIALDRFGPSFNEADVSDKPPWYGDQYPLLTSSDADALDGAFRHRIESMMAIDDLIGRLHAHLQAIGAWENSVLVFTSDNGWFNGEHRAWGKVLAYEESIRVPLFLRGPDIPAGASRTAMALSNDLAPTLAGFAGASLALPSDGRDLRAAFASATPLQWRRRALIEHFRDASWAPVSWADYFAVRTAQNEIAGQANRVLIDWLEDGESRGSEHYALASDPRQIASIPAGVGEPQASITAGLRASLAALRDCGKPGHPSCADAEFAVESVFHGSFD